jgi:hypothetical protein
MFVLGLLTIAALGFVVAHLWHHAHGVAAASPPTKRSAPASPPSHTRPVRNGLTTTARRTLPTTTTRVEHATSAVSLVLTASADTWFEVRSGSATGSILYAGTLPAGSSRAFHARSLWARFGAAGNLSARLGRKRFRLPSGTYSATFDRHGFRRLG